MLMHNVCIFPDNSKNNIAFQFKQFKHPVVQTEMYFKRRTAVGENT